MPALVTLHVYDLSAGLNKPLKLLGTGAFHTGVEVYGSERSYGYSESGTGIFTCDPKKCVGANYRESIEMGCTELSESEVCDLLENLTWEWRGMEYDLLRHNCCVFSSTFCKRLGVGPVPPWVTNLAAAGATLGDGVIIAANFAHCTAILLAAKAGKIDERYNVKGVAQAKARDFILSVRNVDQRFRVRETACGIGSVLLAGVGAAVQKVANASNASKNSNGRRSASEEQSWLITDHHLGPDSPILGTWEYAYGRNSPKSSFVITAEAPLELRYSERISQTGEIVSGILRPLGDSLLAEVFSPGDDGALCGEVLLFFNQALNMIGAYTKGPGPADNWNPIIVAIKAS